MRDNFSSKIKITLAKRAGYKCSNPSCRRMTIGANSNKDKSTNIGVAAHITAASKGGPRFKNILKEERESIENGIWLCQSCSVLIDRDEEKYTINLLKRWKIDNEDETLNELEGKVSLSKYESIKGKHPLPSKFKILFYLEVENNQEIIKLINQIKLERSLDENRNACINYDHLKKSKDLINFSSSISLAVNFQKENQDILWLSGTYNLPFLNYNSISEKGLPNDNQYMNLFCRSNDKLEIASSWIDIYAKHFLGYNSLLDLDNAQITVNLIHNINISKLNYKLKHIVLLTENGLKLYVNQFNRKDKVYIKTLKPQGNWE